MKNDASRSLNVLLIDNFDSFSFNLSYEFESRGCKVDVWRNSLSVEKAIELIDALPKPRLVVLSPGPGTPKNAGCCIDLIRRSAGNFPILGVCLGHQAIIEAFGGTVEGADTIVHGKSSDILHDGFGVFENLPNPMSIARYHSLVGAKISDDLNVTARSGDMVMGVQHKSQPIVGVQFHPESILTTQGSLLIQNVIRWSCRGV